MPATASSPWPYPFWIAHRGAGRLAPENTLAAIRAGMAHGYRMFECDAKLSRDGVLYLMHDAELDRTTSGTGPARGLDWSALAQLDAGSWSAPAYAGEPLPTLANVLRWCVANAVLINIEIKPIPGAEAETGQTVAELVEALWPAHLAPPLLSSFQPAALEAARRASPGQTRGLLLHDWRDDASARAQELQCQALICNHHLWTQHRVDACHAAGLHVLSYTVNERADAHRLTALGTDGIITDRVDLFDPAGDAVLATAPR